MKMAQGLLVQEDAGLGVLIQDFLQLEVDLPHSLDHRSVDPNCICSLKPVCNFIPVCFFCANNPNSISAFRDNMSLTLVLKHVTSSKAIFFNHLISSSLVIFSFDDS